MYFYVLISYILDQKTNARGTLIIIFIYTKRKSIYTLFLVIMCNKIYIMHGYELSPHNMNMIVEINEIIRIELLVDYII